MAVIYKTDFSEYTSGVAPSDWSMKWDLSGGIFSVEAEAQAVYGGKYLQFLHQATNRPALSWDTVGTPEDAVVLALLRPETINVNKWPGTLVLRGQGSGAGERGYCCCLEDQRLLLFKFVGGSYTPIANSVFTFSAEDNIYVRFQVVGNSIKARAWQKDTEEPTTWAIDVTDSSVTGGGWVGVEGSGCDVDWDYFSVGGVGFEPELPTGDMLNSTLPDLEISATGVPDMYLIGVVLPDLEITAAGSFLPFMFADLPEFDVSAAGSFMPFMFADLPTIDLQTSDFIMAYLSETIPELRLSAYASSDQIDLDATYDVSSLYRFVITNVQGGSSHTNAGIAEIEFHTSPGGADIIDSESNSVSASGNIGSSYSAEKAVDNITTTMWNCGTSGMDSDGLWWRIDFDDPVAPVEYEFTSRHDGYLDDSPTEWKVQKWDGFEWIIIHKETTTADWGLSESRTFSIPKVMSLDDVNLPDLEVSATGVPDMYLIGVVLPDLEITAAGSFLPFMFADLPEFDVSAAGSFMPFMFADLPTIDLQTSDFIMAYLSETIPELRLSAYASSDQIDLDATLPDLEISATSSDIHIYIDERPWYGPLIPVLELYAHTGIRANLDKNLPTLEIEAGSGAVLSESLPDLEVTASCSVGYVSHLDARLPVLTCEGRTALKIDVRLPSVSVAATGSSPSNFLATLNKILPGLSVVATGTDQSVVVGHGSVITDLTFPTFAGTISFEISGDVSGILPIIRPTISALSGSIGSLSADLPDLEVSESYCYSGNCSVAGILPYLTMDTYASGDDYGAVESSVVHKGRFEDFTLRHSRW